MRSDSGEVKWAESRRGMLAEKEMWVETVAEIWEWSHWMVRATWRRKFNVCRYIQIDLTDLKIKP
jgi:hypothetical protein